MNAPIMRDSSEAEATVIDHDIALRRAFAERLKRHRVDLGLSQADLAKKCLVPLRSYQNYERAERTAPITFVIAVCTHAPISAEWLLLGNGPAHADISALPRVNNVARERALDQIINGLKALKELT